MNIQIDPEALFSTSEASRMLNIDGLPSTRIRLLCDKGLVPHEMSDHSKQNGVSKGGRYGHVRIRFKDFPKIIEAHEKVRSLSRGPKTTSSAVIRDLTERVEWLEKALFHEFGLSRVDQEHASR